MAGVDEAVRAEAATHGFALEPDQEAALPVLARLATGGEGGAYLWGPPGRGKSWLVDAVLRAAPADGVLRLHAVELYARLHAATGQEQRRDPSGSWARAVAAVLDGVRLLVVDDLQLVDGDDASIAHHVLEQVPAAVVTSNSEVDALHDGQPAGLRRLLRARLVDLPFTGPVDHRSESSAADRPRFSRGAFLSPGGSLRLSDLGLLPPTAADRVVLTVGGRPLPALRVEDDVVWLGFDALCRRPTGVGDHLELARLFRTWVVAGVPDLRGCPPDPLARLLSVVDVAHDADVRLVLVARQPRAATVPDDVDLPGWPRLVSRLRLLQEG